MWFTCWWEYNTRRNDEVSVGVDIQGVYRVYCTVCVMHVYVVFFFQAEDGIRDIGVTGVQTCALPIFYRRRAARRRGRAARARGSGGALLARGARRPGARPARVPQQVLGPLRGGGHARTCALRADLARKTLPAARAAGLPVAYQGPGYGGGTRARHRPLHKRLRGSPPLRAQATLAALRPRSGPRRRS